MGNTNSCIRHLKEVFSSLIGGSSLMEREESEECSTRTRSVEEQIEKSKAHWSTLADLSGCSDDEEESVAELGNVREFQALQSNPSWGSFFSTFYGEDENRYDRGELAVGEKFAEGGQAELYHAQVTWSDPRNTEIDLKYGVEYVLKVFKKRTFLKHLKSQLPHRVLQNHA